MKTNRNPSRGSAKPSPPSQTSKNVQTSSKKNDQISKYFVTNKSPEVRKSDHTDSPYKNILSEIKIVPEDDDLSKDFRTPKPIKIQRKTQNKKPTLRQTKLKSKFTSSRNKNPIFKATQDTFGPSDVNPDHLQMALALSKSTFAVEYPELSQSAEDTFPNFLTPEKIPKGKATLERYGFKSDKPKLHPELRRDPIEVPKKNRNSKFRFITPTLKTRTEEERSSIIATKLSLILSSNKDFWKDSQENGDNELCSDILKKFAGTNSMFAANGFGIEESDKYYKTCFNISPTRSKCGCLLKNWGDIPGREKSPIRDEFIPKKSDKISCDSTDTASVAYSQDRVEIDFEICNERKNSSINININSTTSNHLSVKYAANRECLSPDLFGSESENECMTNSPNTDYDFSQSLLSPSKRRKPSDNFARTSNYTTFKTNYNLEAEDDNSDEIIEILTLKSPSRTKKDELHCSEDEDTEELYISSLKHKDDLLSPKFRYSVAQDEQNCSEDENTEELYKNSLHHNDSPPTKLKNDLDKISFAKDKRPHSNSREVEIVDLTLSSDDDSSSPYSAEKAANKLKINENDDAELSEKSFRDTNGPNTNSEMSPLYVQYSDHVFESESTAFTEKEDGRCSKTSLEISVGLDACNTTLNVTDYVTQILNQDELKTGESISVRTSPSQECDTKTCDSPTDTSETKISSKDEDSYSQESIIISDEELNYSSIHSKDVECKNNFYSLSDFDDKLENENESDLMDVDEIYKVHSALRNKYRDKGISTPIHNRVSELRGKSPLTKASLTTAFLDDSFNDLLESSKFPEELQSETNEKPIDNPPPVEITDDKCTPEKISQTETVVTPENNMIIKTTDVTPLMNYDEMDTPGITRELNNFGLKPLKRQRGVKLLKYLYECTHPLVGPGENEQSSSDEENRERIVKKRKKDSSNRTGISSVTLQENVSIPHACNIEIVGDDILKHENLHELIFERKFSVKILSCRIPLQIVWHNFLSQNSHIKENILLYEPLQLEVLHTMIKEQTGCKFHVHDLLKFFDRKCITIRTAQGTQKKRHP